MYIMIIYDHHHPLRVNVLRVALVTLNAAYWEWKLRSFPLDLQMALNSFSTLPIKLLTAVKIINT
jgi:hypothetical protein